MTGDLKKQSLLKGLEDSEVERLIPLISLKKFPADSVIFNEKDPCKGLYLIISGKLEISKTTPDGWKQPLVILDAGSFLGEIALLENSDHASDARAMEPSELFFMPKEIFEEMERKEPAIMLKIIKNIAIITGLNLRRMNEKFLKALVNY